MTLRSLLVADPVRDVAETVAQQSKRLAKRRIICTDAQQLLEVADTEAPEILLLSLELPGARTDKLLKQLRKRHAELFLVGMYRELSVGAIESLGKLGVDDFVAQPLDTAALYRAASEHFNTFFRRHDRYEVAVDIYRADGVLVGRTRDLSEGGMLMDAFHPVSQEGSLLLELDLPDGEAERVRLRCHVLRVHGEAPSPVSASVQFETPRGREQQRLVSYLSTLPAPADAAE